MPASREFSAPVQQETERGFLIDSLYVTTQTAAAAALAPRGKLVHLPAFNPETFVGREQYLQQMRKALVAKPGVFLLSGEPGQGKSTLALQFAYGMQEEFAAVVFQACGQRSVGVIVEELAGTLQEQIGKLAQSPAEVQVAAIRRWLQESCSLLVLDDVWLEDKPASGNVKIQDLLPGSSVLFTSRRPALPWIPAQQTLPLDAFSAGEVEAAFRMHLGEATVEKHRIDLMAFGERVERLPIAVVVGAQLLQSEFGPLGEVARGLELRRLVNEVHDVPELLDRAIRAQGEEERRLLAACAICAPESFWLPLAVAAAGLESEQGAVARNHLVNAGLLRLMDQERQRFHLHSLLGDQVQQMESGRIDSVRDRHAQVLEQLFTNWEGRWRECRECLLEVVSAGQRLLRKDEAVRANALMNNGFATARRVGELSIALEITRFEEQLWSTSQHPEAKERLSDSYGDQASILYAWGRLQEALSLLKKQEVICEESGNKNSLSSSFGNQAVILQSWGRLGEALALYKKVEVICEESGNRNGLSTNYGNQALILAAWGRLEEALILHKREEAICEESGNRDTLSNSYGNQAVILAAWGRLEEAQALLEKQEVICQELGNSYGLQASYGNQALILKGWGRLEEALTLLKKQEAICEELGNKDSLQQSYGNQANIFHLQGRLEEALALLKRQETICEELGNKSSLGYCHLNWGLLARELKDPDGARQKLEAALSIFTELKMPREREAVQGDLDSEA